MFKKLYYPDFQSYKIIIDAINEAKASIMQNNRIDSSFVDQYGLKKPSQGYETLGGEFLALSVFLIIIIIAIFVLPKVDTFLIKNGFTTLKNSKKVYEYSFYIIAFVVPILCYKPGKYILNQIFTLHQHRRYYKSVNVHRQIRDDLLEEANFTIMSIQDYISTNSNKPGRINIDHLLNQANILKKIISELKYDKANDDDVYREAYFEELKKDKDMFTVTKWLDF